ncbi:MAG: SusF/SusE family outer membrane protein [Prevotella sp.]|nr:SusF/SusE family outer membrane protein [Prevotella sp.]
MKRYFIILATMMAAVAASAQTNLWITGPAVPGGTQKLDKCPNGIFKFAGTLNEGKLKVITTEEIGSGTQYLVPRYTQSYVVNNGLPYTLTRNDSEETWIVPFAEDRYKFVVDTRSRTLTGEIFVPWREVYLAGGACEIGWQAFVMLPFTQDADDPNVFTWTGELKERNEYVEPRRFKLQGQNTWDPKNLHPYTQDEAVLESTQMRLGGEDTKWEIAQDGIYRLTVNVFKETFRAEYLGSEAKDGTLDVDKTLSDFSVSLSGHTIYVKSPEQLKVTVYRADSVKVVEKSGADLMLAIPQRGVYVVKGKGKNISFTKKIVIE